MIIHMKTVGFTEAPGFKATFTALPSSKENSHNSKKSPIQACLVEMVVDI